jgi:Immunity protein 52
MVKEEAMSQIAFDYSIRSELPLMSETPASIGEKFVDTLDALTRIDPTIFTNWEVMDLPAMSSLPLATARSRITELIESNVSRNDFGEPKPDYGGFSAVAFSDKVAESRRVHLRIHTGGKSERTTWLETGDWKVLPDPTIVTYPLFKNALLAINAIWPPVWASANAFNVDYFEVPLAPGAPLFPYSRFHIPWMGYLSAPLTTRMVLPPPEIVTERTADGGLLMVATEDRLDPTDPEHLRRARIIAETMIDRTGYAPSKPAPRR